jgi:prepilin-type processing-associated H-X9-DG protein
MREQLLDYLLGALDADEREEVERKLADDPRWRHELEELRDQLQLLDCGRQEFEPPGDLVARTCGLVASCHEPVTPARREQMTRSSDRLVGRSPALMDLFVATGICVAMAALFFPAVVYSRDEARRATCQNNLRLFGVALHAYSQEYATLPQIPLQGKLSFAGYCPTLLHEAGFFQDASILLCPGAEFPVPAGEFGIPTLDEIIQAQGIRLRRLREVAGGAFGYNLGVYENGRHTAARYEARPNFVWAGDAPSMYLPQRISANHSGRGMNLLFEDGHVAFVWGCRVPGTHDDVLRSYAGFVEAGRFKGDSVIGGSLARPEITPYYWGLVE